MVLLLPLGASPLSAAPLLAGDAPRYDLAGRLEVLRDDSRAMTISQVMAAPARWQPIPDPQPNFGFTSALYWVRFHVASNTDHSLVLSFQYANVDFVDLYVVYPDGRIQRMTSGTRIPFDERPLANRYPVFPLPITRGQEAWFYMQVRDTHSLFPISIWNENAFVRADRREQMVIGLFLGLFFIVVVFNLLFYIATRDHAYLAYVLFVLAYVLFEVAFRGVGGEYLWPRRTWIDDAVEVTSSSVAITMGIVFTRRFLQTRIWAPVLHRILGVLLAAGVVNTICTLVLPFEAMVEVTNGFLLVSAIILIPNAVIVLRRGYRAARFYLVAWVMLLPGCMIFALFNLGVIPSTLLTVNALSFGASLEMILLFLAIVDRFLILRRDSEKLQQERLEAMEKRLYSDTLTELPNRNRLIADLQPGRTVTMILVNIDHFKEINDYFGQKAGDHVIRELGERIRKTVAGRAGAVYRLHADEFAVVIDSAYAADQLEEVGRALTAECQDHAYLYESETLRLDVSIGIAVTDTRHLEKADMALSVTRTKKTFVIYRPELEVIKRYADNLHWLHVMRESIEQDRIVPFFQPILNNSSGAIEKFESLMRIRTTTGEVIPPGAFLTIAKKSKLYPQLSRVIIEKTARIMRPESRDVSINVSFEDIVNPDVNGAIERVISENGLGRRMVFELLESEGIENYAEVRAFIERMKAQGCRIAIDDFGAGYSNFEHILRLDVDYLKLDASLIKPIASDANARCIVETIVSFARKLGIQTIAEYVHSQDVQDVVRSIGVDHSQGYFISEPRPDMSFVLPRSASPQGGSA